VRQKQVIYWANFMTGGGRGGRGRRRRRRRTKSFQCMAVKFYGCAVTDVL